MAKDNVAREIFSPYAEPIPDLTIAAYFASNERIEEDPDTVNAFIAAMKEAQQYAEDHPDDAKAILSEYSSIEPDVVDELTDRKSTRLNSSHVAISYAV